MNDSTFLNYTKKSTPRRGFTLIELLTVITMLGILAGLLFPAGQRLIKNARKLQSTMVLRNIGSVIPLYLMDHNNTMPMLYINQKQTWLNYTYGEPGRISNVLGPYMGATDLIHGKVPEMLRDPSWERSLGAQHASDSVLGQKYRYITHHYQRPGGSSWEDMFPWGNPSSGYWEDPYRFHEIQHPSATWAITDNDRIIQYPRTWSSLVKEPLFDNERSTLFFDGHVAYVSVAHPMFQP